VLSVVRSTTNSCHCPTVFSPTCCPLTLDVHVHKRSSSGKGIEVQLQKLRR
jgi:hypothetical protein